MLIITQWIMAYKDGFSTRARMLRIHNIKDTEYSFIEHCGMWGDFSIITPLTAYLVSKYTFTYNSN